MMLQPAHFIPLVQDHIEILNFKTQIFDLHFLFCFVKKDYLALLKIGPQCVPGSDA